MNKILLQFLQQIKQQWKRKHSLSLSASHRTLSSVDDPDLSRNDSVLSNKPQQKRQRKLTILVGLMTLSFYLCWTPYAVNSFLAMTGVILPQAANVLAVVFTKTGVVLNPVLYIFFNNSVGKPRFLYKF
jgi:urease accessory protein UreF